MLDDVGRGTISVFTYAGGAAELLADAVRFIAAFRVRLRETVDQAYLLGVQSWTIVLLTSLFTGMVFSLESAVQAVQYGVGNLVGGAVAFSSARELGPMLSAVVVAGRTGAAIAAELGSIVGGMWVANLYAHISYESFITSARAVLPFGDVLKGLLKSVVFAVIIAIIGAYQGLTTRGGAAGVGKSTTGAVVTSIILIFISNFLLSYVLFGNS